MARKKKSKKYFLISLTSFILFAILAIVDGSNEEEPQVAKKEAKVEKKATPTSAKVEEPTFPFVEAAGIVYKMVDVKEPEDGINKSKFIKDNVMKGYLATKMKKHVYMFADAGKSGEWVQVTFDDNDKVVKKVEMSPDLEKKVVASVNKEKDTKTAKKEEAQKKADEQTKQEEAKKLEEQKAQQEAQAKAAEEKRKQEEAARVAEQKQKEQEALQAKQQAEAEQARKEAEEKAQQQQPQTQTATFANCTEVRAAGRAPIRQGEPGFQAKFDRDGDGIGCDQ
ncbi:excalibur calcium-binding domain-containing protein [Priestia megaterium]|uniref:excalibur calcium-binding domain-containing protein n=1 Tax=Priestia megaterium TaxID=1404 RepID=UPI0036702235